MTNSLKYIWKKIEQQKENMIMNTYIPRMRTIEHFFRRQQFPQKFL